MSPPKPSLLVIAGAAVLTGLLPLLVPSASAATAAPASPCDAPATRVVQVSTGRALSSALAAAQPGDRVELAAGTYAGRFALLRSGTPTQRVRVCGPAEAVLDGGSPLGGYGLRVVAHHVDLVGFTVTGSLKGIMVDRSTHVVLQGLTVSYTGHEGIHLRSGSSDNVVRDSAVHHTGLVRADFGEGVYVGSAYNNWCAVSACAPDRSDRNQVLRSRFWANGSEAVDIKEGTTGTVVSGSAFDGAGSSALSWVNAKGNDARVVGNRGTTSRRDGFLTEVGAPGWGVRNAFASNVADVRGPGYGVRVRAGNPVPCSNRVTRAAKGYSNVACR